MPTQQEWEQLIAFGAAARPAPLKAVTFLKKWTSASKPAAVSCSDGAVYVVKGISLKAPLEEGPELFSRLYSGDKTLMKVIIQP